jgi:hopanoid C-3 methylase
MKILLINPPRSPYNAILEHAPEEAKRFIHKKLIGPPLGLITIAGAVKDHEVAVLDMKGQYDLEPSSPSPDSLALAWMEKTQPEIVGLTIITSEFKAAMNIAAAIRRAYPKTLIVAGGLHPTLRPQDFSGSPFDIVCSGQSAGLFRQIVEARARHRPFDHIPDIFTNTAAGLNFTHRDECGADAAAGDFVMPERSHLSPWISTYFVGKGAGPTTYLFTSLGCPYSCSFCSIWPQFNARYFQRDVESVVEELKTLVDYPVVRFADANTIVNTSFIRHLFDRIEQESIRKEYVMDLRTDTIAENPGLMEKMARQGLKVVISGFESFRGAELKTYNKSTAAHQIHEAIEILHANGVQIRGNYVIPPHYDEEDFNALSEYASAHRVAFAGYTILTPMPGTSLYETMKSQIVDHDLDKYNFFNCVLRTKLPLEKFYQEIGRLWMIKKGVDTI